VHNHSYENEFNLHVNEISFSYERMGTKTRFEKEAGGNSQMAYCGVIFHLNKVDVHANCSRSGSTPFQRKLTFVAVFFFFCNVRTKTPIFFFLEPEKTKICEDQPVQRRTHKNVGIERPWVAF